VQTRQVPAGESYTASTIVTLPDWADGSYRFVVVSDVNQQIYEYGREANNSLASSALVLGHPDLAVTVVDAPASAQSGSPIDIAWTVVNQGSREVAGTWIDRVWLSQNGTTGATDRLLGEFSRSGPLAAGAGYAGNARIMLPVDLSGDWQVMVRTDATNVVRETAAENDNLASSPITIDLAPYADLEVGNVTAPALTIQDPARVTVD